MQGDVHSLLQTKQYKAAKLCCMYITSRQKVIGGAGDNTATLLATVSRFPEAKPMVLFAAGHDYRLRLAVKGVGGCVTCCLMLRTALNFFGLGQRSSTFIGE